MRVLLLATTTGYQIRSFGEAAEALGAEIVFASDRCDRLDDPWWDRAIPVRFHDEVASLQAVSTALGTGATDGIVAVGDRPAVLAARIAAAWQLPGHPPAAAAAARDKLATRRLLQAAGLPTPAYAEYARGEPLAPFTAALTYPVVIKPLALTGSRGVMRADDPASCAAGIERLLRLLDEPDVRVERDAAHDRVLVEAFVPGREFAVEGLLTEGRFSALAVFDKPDPLDGPYFEETIYVTPPRVPGECRRRIVQVVSEAARALGLYHGPVHAECRTNANGVYVLEVAARPIGGLCSRALRFAAPDGAVASLEELLLRHAVGQDVSHYRREDRASGVMMIPIPGRGVLRGVEGVDAARAVRHVEDVRITAKIDTLLRPLPEAKAYLGFIFARGDDPALVERSLREAHATLRFAIDRAVPVTPAAPA